MIPIKKVKQIREELGLTHLVIFGITEDGLQHVVTHGKSKNNAIEAATIGNDIKKTLDWPIELCYSKPLERKCENCDFWQRGYHRPGDVIESNMHGFCIHEPQKVKRHEEDLACSNFSPNR